MKEKASAGRGGEETSSFDFGKQRKEEWFYTSYFP